MPRIFISHGSSDKAFVRQLTSDLARFGIDVWLDEKEIRVGESIREAIEIALEDSDFGIIVMSKNSITRPWVKLELNALFSLEIERGKSLILPAVIEPIELPLLLRDKKYADFSKDYDAAFEELLKVFARNGSAWDIETSHCHVYLDIKKLDGSLVRAVKKQKIIARKNGVETYLDVCSADGTIENIKVSPGSIRRIWKEIGTSYVKSYFPKPLNRGDCIEHTIDSNFVDSFCTSQEFWEERQFHPTKHLSIEIAFLKTRPPKEVWAVERRGSDGFLIKGQPKLSNKRGRTIVSLVVRNPTLMATYQVFWRW